MSADAILAALEAIHGALEDLRIELADLRQSSLHVPVDGLVGIREVCDLLVVSDRSLRRMRARPGFPKPVKGPGRPRWRRPEILGWAEGKSN